MKRRNLEHIFLYICFAIIIVCCSIVGYWLLYPYNVITFNAPYETVRKTYHPGEALDVNVDITQNTDGVKVTVIRQLQNDFVVNFPDTSYVTRKGRQVFKNNSIMIPEFAPKGTYHLLTTSIYHVNPIRNVLIIRETNEFKVK